MDGKTPRGFAYSGTNSKITGKSSRLQVLKNRHSPAVRVTENIAKAKNLVPSSSSDNKFICQEPLKLFSTSVGKQKPLSSQVNQSFLQQSSIVDRINETVKSNVPKCTPKQLETSETMSKSARIHKMRNKPGCGTLHAPTISFTQRLIASRDAKEAKTKYCNLKKAIPSVSQSIPVPRRRDSTEISKSFTESSKRKLSGPLTTRPPASNTPNVSRVINKSKINDHLGIGTSKGFQARGNPPCESVVAPTSFSRSLDNDSFSRRKNFIRTDIAGRPTSSPGRGRILSSYRYSVNILVHSSNHHDQHSEMRMNIDDMSYEELLELQEKMGSVCTGLTDEALTKCLKRSNFKPASSPSGIADSFDGNGCSICQEDCDDGEEIGTLACEHWYHVVCIQQWLRLKNWCPICKASASC